MSVNEHSENKKTENEKERQSSQKNDIKKLMDLQSKKMSLQSIILGIKNDKLEEKVHILNQIIEFACIGKEEYSCNKCGKSKKIVRRLQKHIKYDKEKNLSFGLFKVVCGDCFTRGYQEMYYEEKEFYLDQKILDKQEFLRDKKNSDEKK